METKAVSGIERHLGTLNLNPGGQSLCCPQREKCQNSNSMCSHAHSIPDPSLVTMGIFKKHALFPINQTFCSYILTLDLDD